MGRQTRRKKTFWLSYGGGRNSTALAIMLVNGQLPEYTPFRLVFADTQDEKDETYDFIYHHFMPWLRKRGHTLEVVRDCEGVLERWERLGVTGSRLIRSCTRHAKSQPIALHVAVHGTDADCRLLGISSDEAHRAQRTELDGMPVHYPLVENDIDLEGCISIIKAADLPVPSKSGCWHCPFMKVGEILSLANNNPCAFMRIEALEKRAEQHHPPNGGERRTHWKDHTVEEWRQRANGSRDYGETMFQDEIDNDDTPCACVDG